MGLLILKIVLQILAVAAALLANRLDYVTTERRTRAFKRGRQALQVISVIFLAGSILALVLDDLDKKRDIERLSQPIQDVYVSVMYTIPASNDLFRSYLGRLKPAIAELARSPQRRDLIAQGKEKDGSITSVRIPPQSPFFPNKDTEKYIYFILNQIQFDVQFFVGSSHDLNNPDFMCNLLTSIDNTSKQSTGSTGLSYNVPQNYFLIRADNISCPSNRQRNTGKITSIPDLLESSMTIFLRGNELSKAFFTTEQSYYDTNHEISNIHRSSSITRIFMNISGREFSVRENELQRQDYSSGTIKYTGRLSDRK
jgi:hypothetical protein